MNAKKSMLLIAAVLFLLALSLSATAVYNFPGTSGGGSSTSIFATISSVFGNQDFDTMYNQYWWIIDLIIYLFLFGYIGKLTIGHQFGNKGGPLGVIVGVALSVATVFFESTSGFRLGNLGPFALAVALALFMIVIFRMFDGLNLGKGFSGAITFVAGYGFLLTVAQPLFKWMNNQNNPWISSLVGILNIALVISVVAIIWGLARKLPGMFGGGNALGGNLGGLIKNAGGSTQNADRQEIRQDKDEIKQESKDIAEATKAGLDETVTAQLVGAEINALESLKNFLQQLQQVATRLNREQAKVIAKARTGPLRDAVKRLLNYSQRAKKANEDSEKRLKRVIDNIGRELRSRAKADVQEAKKHAADKGIKKDAYDATYRGLNIQINKSLEEMRMEAYQSERSEQNIENTLNQVIAAENQIKQEVEALIKDLQGGNLYAINQITLNILAGVESAEQALAAAERIALGVRNYATDLRRKFFQTETKVKEDIMAAEYNALKNR